MDRDEAELNRLRTYFRSFLYDKIGKSLKGARLSIQNMQQAENRIQKIMSAALRRLPEHPAISLFDVKAELVGDTLHVQLLDKLGRPVLVRAEKDGRPRLVTEVGEGFFIDSFSMEPVE